MKRFLTSLLSLLWIVFLASSPMAVEAGNAGQSGSRSLEDGEWTGHYRYNGMAVGEGYTSAFSYVGNLFFTITDGSADGEWEATVTSGMNYVMQLAKGQCTLILTTRGTMKGVVEGTASSPILRDTEVMDTTFESRSSGPGCDPQALSPYQRGALPMSIETHVSRPVDWAWVTCEQAYGHMGGGRSVSIPRVDRSRLEEWRAAGISMSGSDEVYVVRTAALRPSTEAERLAEEVERLFADFFAFVDLLLPLDDPITPYLLTLDELLARAERLTRELQRLPDCAGIDPEAYVSMLASGVARVIEYVLENPARATASDLYRLILAGVRTGLFNERPVYTYGEETLRPRLLEELERRTAETSDCVDLLLLAQAFTALGNPTSSAYRASFAACGG